MDSSFWENIFPIIMITIPVISLIMRLKAWWISRKANQATQKAAAQLSGNPGNAKEEDENLPTDQAPIRMAPALLVWIVGSVVAGLMAGLIGSFIYFTILSPLVMGFVGSGLLQAGRRLFWIRKRWVFLPALLIAVVMYGSFHYGRYMALQLQTMVRFSSELSQASDLNPLTAARVLVNYGLEKETGHSGLYGYMLYRAQKGVTIGKFYSSDRLHLNAVFTWVYWIFEMGIILSVVWYMGRTARYEAPPIRPTCAVCGRRYGDETHLGGIPSTGESQMMALLDQRDFDSLGRLLESNADLPSTELYLQRCPVCRPGSSYLTIRRAFRNPGGALQFQDISSLTLTPGDGLLFAGALAAKSE